MLDANVRWPAPRLPMMQPDKLNNEKNLAFISGGGRYRMADGFTKLCTRLTQIDLFGTAGEAMPQGSTLSRAIKEAAPLLPPVYQPAYVTPLEASLQRLIRIARHDPTTVETLTAAVYQHRAGDLEVASLNRLLAVISDLFRSFLDKDKRSNAGVPL